MAFFNYSQQFVNGCVTVKLYKGNVIPVARKSPTNSLYDEALVSMNILGGFNVTDTAGYQKIKSIRIIN
jgi:argininosuccinate synthase